MGKTLKDAKVGDIITMTFEAVSVDNGYSISLRSLDEDKSRRRAAFAYDFPVKDIIPAPWVPKIGDKYHYKSDSFNTYRRGMEGNNWWIYTVTLVDPSNIVQVKDE